MWVWNDSRFSVNVLNVARRPAAEEPARQTINEGVCSSIKNGTNIVILNIVNLSWDIATHCIHLWLLDLHCDGSVACIKRRSQNGVPIPCCNDIILRETNFNFILLWKRRPALLRSCALFLCSTMTVLRTDARSLAWTSSTIMPGIACVTSTWMLFWSLGLWRTNALLMTAYFQRCTSISSSMVCPANKRSHERSAYFFWLW